jgi:hypothetical protein
VEGYKRIFLYIHVFFYAMLSVATILIIWQKIIYNYVQKKGYTMFRLIGLVVLHGAIFFVSSVRSSDLDQCCSNERNVGANDGSIKRAYMWTLRKIKEHPYCAATVVWLAYFKGGNTVQFLKEIVSSWFVAIPLGAAVLHKSADCLLGLDSWACEDGDAPCEFTISINSD